MLKLLISIFFLSIFSDMCLAQEFKLDSTNSFFYINTYDGSQLLSIKKTLGLSSILKLTGDEQCKKIYGIIPLEHGRNCLEYKNGQIINPSTAHILIKINNSTKKTEELFISQVENPMFYVSNVINDFVKPVSSLDFIFDLTKFENKRVKMIVNGKLSPLHPIDICMSAKTIQNSLIVKPKEALPFFGVDELIIFINDRD
jgi:hypothetical protein